MMPRIGDKRLPARFWEKVLHDGDGGCWLWTASKTVDGYGCFHMPDGRTTAHRIAYEELVGPIPEGLVIDHLCRTRNCVNPRHMETVTQSMNLLRGDTANARKAAQSSCIHGHEFTPENTYTTPNGRRQCRACHAARQRKHMTKKEQHHA